MNTRTRPSRCLLVQRCYKIGCLSNRYAVVRRKGDKSTRYESLLWRDLYKWTELLYVMGFKNQRIHQTVWMYYQWGFDLSKVRTVVKDRPHLLTGPTFRWPTPCQRINQYLKTSVPTFVVERLDFKIGLERSLLEDQVSKSLFEDWMPTKEFGESSMLEQSPRMFLPQSMSNLANCVTVQQRPFDSTSSQVYRVPSKVIIICKYIAVTFRRTHRFKVRVHKLFPTTDFRFSNGVAKPSLLNTDMGFGIKHSVQSSIILYSTFQSKI